MQCPKSWEQFSPFCRTSCCHPVFTCWRGILSGICCAVSAHTVCVVSLISVLGTVELVRGRDHPEDVCVLHPVTVDLGYSAVSLPCPLVLWDAFIGTDWLLNLGLLSPSASFSQFCHRQAAQRHRFLSPATPHWQRGWQSPGRGEPRWTRSLPGRRLPEDGAVSLAQLMEAL